MYGHPGTFQRQLLNGVLTSYNPYLSKSNPSQTEDAGSVPAADTTSDRNVGDTAMSDEYYPSDAQYDPAAMNTNDNNDNYNNNYYNNTTNINNSNNMTNNTGSNEATPLVSQDGTVYLGSREGLIQAQYQTQNAAPGQQMTQYVYIPKEVIGAVIGKQGSKINEIRKMSILS